MRRRRTPATTTTNAIATPPGNVQVRPSPSKPPLQVHVNVPMRLRHWALTSHGTAAHSLTSMQERPLPVKPSLHVHVKPKPVPSQVACDEQSLVLPDKHS